MSVWRLAVGMIVMGSISLDAMGAAALNFPTKPLRIVAGPTGGASDPTSRIVAQELSKAIGQPVIVDNRNAILSAEELAKGSGDGYTMVVSGPTIYTSSLLQKMNYDAEKDLAPITIMFITVNALATHPSVPVKSVKELIALAKAKPGALNYSSGESGGTAHLATALFASMAGINIVQVPYKATGQRITSVVAGEVQMAINEASLLYPHIKAGRLTGLGVTSLKPSPLFPELPTVAAELPGYEAVSTFGIWTGGKTPRAIVTKLNQEIVRVLHSKEVQDQFFKLQKEPIGNTPQEFAQIISTDRARMAKLIKDANIKLGT